MIPSNRSRVPTVAVIAAYNARWFVLAFYVCLAAGCIYPAMQLTGNVSQRTTPPQSSKALAAANFYDAHYPSASGVTGFILYFVKSDARLAREKASRDQRRQPSSPANNNNRSDSPRAIVLDLFTESALFDRFDFSLEYFARSADGQDGGEAIHYYDGTSPTTTPTPSTTTVEIFSQNVILSKAYLDSQLQQPPLLSDTSDKRVNDHYYTNVSLEGQRLFGAAGNVFNSSHDFPVFNSYSSPRSVAAADLPREVGFQYLSAFYDHDAKYYFPPSSGSAGGASAPYHGLASEWLANISNRSASVIISLKVGANDPRTAVFARQLEEVVLPTLLAIHGLGDDITAYIISMPNFMNAIGGSVATDLRRMFLVIIPLSLILFGASLSGFRLALLPIATMAVSLLVTMALLYGVTTIRDENPNTDGRYDVNSMAPGVVVMLGVALSLDFCYFLASQWKRVVVEEIEHALHSSLQDDDDSYGQNRKLMKMQLRRRSSAAAAAAPLQASDTKEENDAASAVNLAALRHPSSTSSPHPNTSTEFRNNNSILKTLQPPSSSNLSNHKPSIDLSAQQNTPIQQQHHQPRRRRQFRYSRFFGFAIPIEGDATAADYVPFAATVMQQHAENKTQKLKHISNAKADEDDDQYSDNFYTGEGSSINNGHHHNHSSGGGGNGVRPLHQREGEEMSTDVAFMSMPYDNEGSTKSEEDASGVTAPDAAAKKNAKHANASPRKYEGIPGSGSLVFIESPRAYLSYYLLDPQGRAETRDAALDAFHAYNTRETLAEVLVDRAEVMRRVYSAAGKTLVVSAAGIAFASIGIMSFDVRLVQSVGVTIFVTTLVTGIVAATLPATLLLTFHAYFFSSLERWCDSITPETTTSPDAFAVVGTQTQHQTSVGVFSSDSQSPADGSSANNLSEGLLSSEGDDESVGGGNGRFKTLTPASMLSSAAMAAERTLLRREDGTTGEDGGDNKPQVAFAPVGGHHQKQQQHGKRHIRRRSTQLLQKRPQLKAMIAQAAATEAEYDLLKAIAKKSQQNAEARLRWYEHLEERLTRTPLRASLSVIGALLPMILIIAFGINTIVYSNNVSQFVPRGSAVLEGWRRYKGDFPPGQLFTYNLVLEMPSATEINDEKFYLSEQLIISRMAKELPFTRKENFAGVGFNGALQSSVLQAKGGNISRWDYVGCAFTHPPTPLCSYYFILSSVFTAPASSACAINASFYQPCAPNPNVPAISTINILLDFDPTSQYPGHDWYVQARDVVLPSLERDVSALIYNKSVDNGAKPHVKLYLKGYPGETFETIDYAANALRIILPVIVIVLMLIALLAFHSAVIALRIATNVVLTVGTAAGIVGLVYIHGALAWLKFSGLEPDSIQGALGASNFYNINGNARVYGEEPTIVWQVPFIAVLLSAAVSLNYELILTAKIVDYRWRRKDRHGGGQLPPLPDEVNKAPSGVGAAAALSTGPVSSLYFTTREAIIHGTAVVGREVTVAALMMAVVFAGFVLSHVPALNTIGAVLVATSLVSAFWVRLLLNPPLMVLLGEWNWLPAQCLAERLRPPS